MYEAKAVNLRGGCIGAINSDDYLEIQGFIKEKESVISIVTVREESTHKRIYKSNVANLRNIYKKINGGIPLHRAELNAIDDVNVCSVGNFTGSVGHLTTVGKNTLVRAYRHEITREIKRHF
jgi:hypothetical protein